MSKNPSKMCCWLRTIESIEIKNLIVDKFIMVFGSKTLYVMTWYIIIKHFIL